MQGLMMSTPLLVSSLIRHADQNHGDTEIVSRTVEGGIHRYTYRDLHGRARQLANALQALGVRQGDRVATLAWNGYRHMEIYFAVGGMGAVCHTVNPRLFPDQLQYIVQHADDSYLFFDLTFLPLVKMLAPRCPGVKGWVAMTDRAHMPDIAGLDLLCYEDLLRAHSDQFDWPELDENTACGLCYTSGTTGNPKGALYSNRSTVLHCLAVALPDSLNLSASDVLLPVVPMFHVNAWGLPYACAATGTKLVFPGAALDGKSVFELLEQEQVTVSAGVPTVWMGLLQHVQKSGLRFGSLRRTVIGGSAAPPSMIRTFEEEYGVAVLHAWGMTETSPVGTANAPKAKHLGLPRSRQLALKSKQGRAVFGVEMRIVDPEGKPLPHDGQAFGHLHVRGPWIIASYFKSEGGSPLRDGWFPTGDVATIDPDGYMQIVDRSKDVIKSGGEWISSVELENVAVGHPAVAEAAVIGVAHPKWDERPLLVVVRKQGQDLTREELLAFFEGKVAKWCVPDDVVFVDQLPHTATGKLLKMKLRDDFAKHRLPGA